MNDPANGTTTFQYDKGGNLVYEKTYAYTTGSLGSVTSTKQYSYQYDRLVSVTENGVTTNITYDVSGNPLTYHNGMSFEWEMGRQLAGITNGNTTISYTYNEEGIRTSKTVNGVTTEYTLVDGRITYQTDGTTSMYFRYDGDDELIGFEYTVNGVTNEYYYVKNLQGDIIDILDNNGNVVVSYEYDAWGEILSVSGSLAGTVGQANPFKYRSYYYDNESGFYYLQSRYYDAGVRRFINADEIMFLGASGTVLGYNLYAYCENNPVNYVDNTGYVAANVIGAVIGLVLGAVGGYFLSRFLADKIGLKGWKRTVFIVGISAIISASAAVIGYFIGPYVGKVFNKLLHGLRGLFKPKYGTQLGKLGILTRNSKPIIKGFTQHGLQRMTQRGVSKALAQKIVNTGYAIAQSGGKVLYFTKEGVVVLTASGQVVTAYSSAYFDETMQAIVNLFYK